MITPWAILILILTALPSIAEARREQTLQDTPLSITAVSSETLASGGIADTLESIKGYGIMPASTGTAGGNYTSRVTIRGIGSSSPQRFVDGVSIGKNPGTGGFPLFDIERVEVLRGPQGTLYGRNALNRVVSTRIRNDDYLTDFDSIPGDFLDSPATYNSDTTYSNQENGWGEYGRYYDPNLAKGFFTGDLSLPANHYNHWGQTYSNLNFDDLYTYSKSMESTSNHPLLSNFFWIKESNKFVEKKDAGYPNDPLYPKKGSTGKAGVAKKAIGSILNMFGSSFKAPTDQASAQWGLPETGFYRRGEETSAWNIAAGDKQNVIVAVIDSGLDMTHIDGPRYVWTNPGEIDGNGIDDDHNGYVDDVHGWNFYSETNDITDDNGHGTFVAGIIAAKTNNGEGIAGINPGARIMPLKVLNDEGMSRILAVYRAIRYAVDNGARVLNLSLGGKGITRLEQIGINYAYAMGCVVVVAAGNEASNIASKGPPGARRAFSVAAMDMDGKPRSSSNRGLNVAVTAPGQSIYSLTAKEGNRDGKFMPMIVGKYFRSSGTSFSAPFVTGVASLIWSKYPDLSNRMVEDMILQSAKDIHDPGWDPHTGYGLLDGHGAMEQNPGELLVPRITEVYVNKERRRISSVDLYGVIRGNLDHYMVSVGRGKDPSNWEVVFGPATAPLDYLLISRIDGIHFAKGSQWTVKLDAVNKKRQTKSVRILISKDKG